MGGSPEFTLSTEASRAARNRTAVFYLLLTATSLASRLPFLRHPFLNTDEAAPLLGSWELLRGGRLYLDFADNKPPLVHLVYAFAQLLGGEGILAVRLLAALALIPLTALAASAFFGHSRRGKAAALAFIVASAALLPSDAQVLHCEHVLLLPLAWSLVLLRSPRSLRRPGALFSAGLLLGVATLAKQPAAACLLVPAVLVVRAARPPHGVLRRRALRIVGLWAALLAGFSLPLLAAAAYFADQGALAAAVDWIWRVNLRHIANPMPLPDRIARAVTMGALVAPSAGALLTAALLGRDRLASPHRRDLCLLLCAATFFPALLGLRLFGHYFLPLLFALSLAAAPFLGARGPVPLRRPLLAFGAFAAAAFTLAGRLVHDPARALADVSRPEYDHIADALRKSAPCAGGALFVWGYAPALYARAAMRPASRFVVPVDTLTGYLAGNDAVAQGRVDTRARIVPAHWDQLMADLLASRPGHIVDTAPADLNRWGRFPLTRFPRLLDLVRREYHPATVVDGAVIYLRNDCVSPRSAPSGPPATKSP
jgi:hypothetical protein